MSEMRKIDIVSMHLPQLALGGHRISPQMGETKPSDMVGTLRVYPGAGGCIATPIATAVATGTARAATRAELG